MPASTMTGTVARRQISSRLAGLATPIPEPISDPIGMTAARAGIGKTLANHRIVGAIGQHDKTVIDEVTCRLDELGHVGVKRLAVADHFQLEPLRIERLTGKFSGPDRVARRFASCRIGQEAVIREQAHGVKAVSFAAKYGESRR